jgi:K+-transporting ATPase KdpF subunit
MSILYLIAGVVALGLLIYLFIALLDPDALEKRANRGGTR